MDLEAFRMKKFKPLIEITILEWRQISFEKPEQDDDEKKRKRAERYLRSQRKNGNGENSNE